MDKIDYLLQNPFDDEDAAKRAQELLNSNFSRVDFSYSKEEINKILDEYIKQQELKNESTYSVIEDYEDETTNPEILIGLSNEVKKFFDLDNKDNIDEVEKIVNNIGSKYRSEMNIPSEMRKSIEEIRKHYEYLLSSKLKERAAEYQKEAIKNEEVQKQETAAIEKEKIEESRIQQERLNEIQSKLPIINEKIIEIRKRNLDKDKMNQLLKERVYFYNKKSNITAEDIDRLNAYMEELDKYFVDEVKIDIKPTPEVKVPDMTEVIELADEILNESSSQYKYSMSKEITEIDKKMEEMMEIIKPYMSREDVSKEMAKVERENNKAKDLLASGSVDDYKQALAIKQRLSAYLEKACAFIFEREREAAKKEKDSYMDNVYMGEMYYKNGTYRPEYIEHLVSVARNYGGEEMAQTVRAQLLEYNNDVLINGPSNKEELDAMMNDPDFYNREIEIKPSQYGFSGLCILGLGLTISGIIIILVSLFMR